MPKQPLQLSNESNRMWASTSFVAVLILFGFPLWWKTTEVYRVALPYDKINTRETEFRFIAMELVVHADDEETAAIVAKDIAKAFDKLEILKLLVKHEKMSNKLHKSLGQSVDEVEALEEVTATVNVKKSNTFHLVQKNNLDHDVWLADGRVAFFKDKKSLKTIIQVLTTWVLQPSLLKGALSMSADEARRMRISSENRTDILLTVVHPRPQEMKVVFNTTAAVENYLGAFAEEISELHNFTLKSQWLYMMDFDFKAKRVLTSIGPMWWVNVERLPLLLSQLDGQGRGAVRFAVYILPCDIIPLVLHDKDNAVDIPIPAFMSPKWGGVVLLSPSYEDCARKSYEVPTNMLMSTFISHLRKLTGITDKGKIEQAHLAPLQYVVPRAWEMDTLLRMRTIEQVSSSQRSLKSLAKLLGEIPNIVITDEVGGYIKTAVVEAGLSVSCCEKGELIEAQNHARLARIAAETAFTEPSLLALLYFPDDQKYAIYIPLFLPIMFPVILSLKKLRFWLRKKGYGGKKEKID